MTSGRDDLLWQRLKESRFYQELMDEGRVEAKRADTLVALEERFGPEAASQVAADVNRVKDLQQLDQLHRLAIRCASIDDFRQALSAAAAPRPPRRRRGSPRRRTSQ